MNHEDINPFGPQNEEEERIFAEEEFRVDVQQFVHNLMTEKKVSQRELARRLKVTEARVSQVFSDNCNVTVRVLARIFHALDEHVQFQRVAPASRSGSVTVSLCAEDEASPSVAFEVEEWIDVATLNKSRFGRYRASESLHKTAAA